MKKRAARAQDLEQTIKELREESEYLRTINASLAHRLIGLRLVHDTAHDLATELDMDRLWARILQAAMRAVEGAAGSLLLLDPTRQELEFAVVRKGMGPALQGQRMSVDEGLADWVVRNNQPAIVSDTQSDPRYFGQITAEAGLEVKSLLCAPLVTRGQVLGALEIVNKVPLGYFDDDLDLLTSFAAQAAIAIARARLYQQELEKELAVARRIQLDMLPKHCPVVPGWQSAVFYQPARLVGGDFYDFFELPGEPGRWWMVIADVADKGVPAALFMALSRTMIRTSALAGRSPVAALLGANQLILDDSSGDLFLTVFYAELDTRNGRLTYANAGHHRPLWWQSATHEIHDLAALGIVLGALETIDLEECTIAMMPGDAILFYTVGVTDAMDSAGQLFGAERLRHVVATHAAASAQQLLAAVVQAVHDFGGTAPQSDDLTVFVVKRQIQNVS
jgi:serine phosphatase RsbU (regulator of sigma subunit)